MRRMLNSLTVVAATLALGLSACEGPLGPQGEPGQKGDTGATGASGKDGTNGKDGVSAPTTGTISGVVTDAMLKDALAGVTVTVKDSGGVELGKTTTDNTGKFTLTAPMGGVMVYFAKDYFTSPNGLLIGVLGGQTVTLNATLAEATSGKPSVSIAMVGDDFGFGGTVNLTVAASDPNGDTLTYTWANNTVGGYGKIEGNGSTATVTMPKMADVMQKRLEDGKTASQYIMGYTLEDRFGIVPIMPDTRGTMSIAVTVSDGRGQSATASVSPNAASVATGLKDVPVGMRLYLNSGHATNNAWTLTPPQGSTAKLDDAAVRTPSFVLDIKGAYTVTEGTSTMTIYAGDWAGAVGGGTADKVKPDENCTSCHTQGGPAPDNFTPWAETGHARMFAFGLTGTNGASWGASCIGCHTVGYDKGVANNGFDDVALKNNWTLPAKSPTAWEDMIKRSPDVAKLAGIQCENCHGPNVSSAHTKTAAGIAGEYVSSRISFSAELCGTCHGAGTGHHLYSEWSTTDKNTGWGHSNRKTAALGASATGMNNHCGRCHTAQGFVQYGAQAENGNPGNLLVTTGVTTANAEPVTCTACHDPHSAKNPSQLRVYGDTPMLAAGFSMWGVGKGALCLECHNSRNATYTVNNSYAGTYLHEDGEAYNAGNPTGYSAPHQACQGDVFAGRNAYFMGSNLPMTSHHAAIEDTCVGCHMAKNPEKHLSHGAAATSTHVFRITEENKGALCAECHGEGVNGEGLQASIEAGLVKLAKKMGDAVKAKIVGTSNGMATLVGWDAATDLYTIAPGAAKNPNALQPLVIDTTQNPIVSVGVEEIHGQIGFVLNMTNPVTLELVDASTGALKSTVQSKTVAVRMGDIKDATGNNPPLALFTLSSNLVRAGWNYFLIEGDQSLGIHNPSFAMAVLNNTIAKDLTK